MSVLLRRRQSTPESVAVAQQVADRSVTLVRNSGDFVPLKTPANMAFFLLTESRTGVQGQAFQQELKKRSPLATVFTLDSSMTGTDIQFALDHSQTAQQYVVAAYASVAAYRGNVALGGSYPALIENLLATKKPVMLVALGNPYLLRNFPKVAVYMTTYSSVPVAEIAAVKALFAEFPIDGKLPVTIPGFANYGDGLTLAPAVK
jgi:beta-N-acetylhexosaminidase